MILALGWSLVPNTAAATVTQLSSHLQTGCTISSASSNFAGTRIAIESNCDLTGANPDGNREIFLVDPLGAVAQLTDTTGCANADPSIDALGGSVAFDSDCDFDGGNVDGSVEIFIATTVGVTQLTHHDTLDRCESLAPSSDALGTVITFDSDCDLVGSNFDRNTEIYQVNVARAVEQVTSDATMSGCGSFNASSSADGDVVYFESDCDLVGGNEEGISEIFRANLARAATTIMQMTFAGDDTCFSGVPATDAAGNRIVFESNCNFDDRNADGGVEVFRLASTGSIVQLSDSQSAACESFDAVISGDGLRTAFTSYCDPSGANADGGLEVFAASMIASTQQLSEGTDCWSFSPSFSFDGHVTTFLSDCDVTGANADGSAEVFQTDGIACGACGAPVSGKQSPQLPTASDALFVLQSSVGLASCPLCECDVDSSSIVTATDALNVLMTVIGGGGELMCP